MQKTLSSEGKTKEANPGEHVEACFRACWRASLNWQVWIGLHRKDQHTMCQGRSVDFSTISTCPSCSSTHASAGGRVLQNPPQRPAPAQTVRSQSESIRYRETFATPDFIFHNSNSIIAFEFVSYRGHSVRAGGLVYHSQSWVVTMTVLYPKQYCTTIYLLSWETIFMVRLTHPRLILPFFSDGLFRSTVAFGRKWNITNRFEWENYQGKWDFPIRVSRYLPRSFVVYFRCQGIFLKKCSTPCNSVHLCASVSV